MRRGAFAGLALAALAACSDAPPAAPPQPPPIQAQRGPPSDAQIAAGNITNPFAESGPPPAPKAIAADAARDVQVLGALTSAQIVDVVRRQHAHVTNCARTSTPPATGLVVVKLVIGADGRVKQAQAIESSMGRAEVEDCLVGALKTWAFPEPKAGGTAIVTYPFRLE